MLSTKPPLFDVNGGWRPGQRCSGSGHHPGIEARRRVACAATITSGLIETKES